MNDIVASMWGIATTGVRPPPPPPPGRLDDAVVRIVGLAETIKVLALDNVTKHLQRS